jgi:hypothetical protein
MKFGYPSKKKVEKFNESCYCLNMAISEKKFPGNLEILSHIFSQKSSACVSLDYFGVN